MKRKLVYFISILLYFFCLLLPLFNMFFDVPIEDEGTIHLYSCTSIDCFLTLEHFVTEGNDVFCVFYDFQNDSLWQTITSEAEVLFFDAHMHKVASSSSLPLPGFVSSGLMHHKFCVADNQYVLTGTWNPTRRGTYLNDNVIILLDSKEIALSYLDIYDWLKDRANGVRKTQPVLQENFLLSDIPITLCFSPEGNCEQVIIDVLSQAKTSIKGLAFTFTSKPIFEVLETQFLNNIAVEIIFEKTRITRYSMYESMLDLGMVALHDGNSYTMHEKVFIIDDSIVIVGSYNPTAAANTKNDENLLVVYDEHFAKQMLEEYERIRAQALA